MVMMLKIRYINDKSINGRVRFKDDFNLLEFFDSGKRKLIKKRTRGVMMADSLVRIAKEKNKKLAKNNKYFFVWQYKIKKSIVDKIKVPQMISQELAK